MRKTATYVAVFLCIWLMVGQLLRDKKNKCNGKHHYLRTQSEWLFLPLLRRFHLEVDKNQVQLCLRMYHICLVLPSDSEIVYVSTSPSLEVFSIDTIPTPSSPFGSSSSHATNTIAIAQRRSVNTAKILLSFV